MFQNSFGTNLYTMPTTAKPAVAAAAAAKAGETPADVDAEALKEYLSEFLPLPGSIRYRTELDGGPLDAKELEKRTQLLLGLRKIRSHLPQKFPENLITDIAADKEETWHLAGEKKTLRQRLCQDASLHAERREPELSKVQGESRQKRRNCSTKMVNPIR